MRYFFYGTLLDPDVRRAVLGRPAHALRGRHAVLDGYRRVTVPEKSYPTLAADAGGAVAGLVFGGITPALARRLNVFEGTAYRIACCHVRLEDGAVVSARVFVPRLRPPSGGRPWDYEGWKKKAKRRFLAGLDRERPEAGAGGR
jgi:hypothetical protein